MPKMEFYKKVGISAAGYSDMVEKQTMKVSTLEKIAEVLDIPVYMFFLEKSQTVNEDSVEYSTNSWKDRYIKCQEEKSELQEKIIELLTK